jgi:hypothetical protein
MARTLAKSKVPKERLPDGCIGKSSYADGKIVRYHLVNGWFVDRSTGAHKDPLFLYTIWEPGGGDGGGAARRGGSKKLKDAIVSALRQKPA